ncbi:MAG: CDF family Co(II)/Ni(II) efflux transporter DmeF, partial [Magnetococcales bacterium]|nr:CDF family Co(II)/Ni(II) efflux transporter DmeF [Magnetococcales bacterium]
MNSTHLAWQHSHSFGLDQQQAGEIRTRWVIAITLSMMVIELIAGYLTGSMALTADGWHMSTHATALTITAFAYAFARNNAHNPRFTFGTGKVGVLSAFASAIGLAIVALWMLLESIDRFLNPVTIRFQDALLVAAIGLVVNIVSALLLGGDHHGHGHSHGHGHDYHDDHDHDDHDHHDHDDHDHGHHDHHPRGQDHNLRSAYLHVIADALTSVTALVALTCGMYLGWNWMDPLMGV